MAAASREKTFSGTFLVPGVSLNKRLYTKEMIGKAVARMKARIADPDGLPIVMRTHHNAGDDSQLITARIVAVEQQSDGRGSYTARWYDTGPARDIAALVQPEDGAPPALRTVSIHGYFLGEARKVEVDGEEVVTSDDLEIDMIDFTATPGVVKALIDAPGGPGRRSEAAPLAPGRVPVFETWEVPVGENADALPVTDTIAETAPADDEAYTAAQKRDALDAGQAMKNAKGEPSYTIKNKADLRRAIRAVGRGGADHDKIRAHVIARARALGLSKMIPDNWNADGSLKETGVRFGEIRECYDSGPDGRAGFAIDAYNGPVSLTLRAPSLDPSGLRAIASAAMDAALDALGALDPDFDADIDVPGAPAEDTDGDMGTGEAATGTPPDPNDMSLDDIEDGHNPAPGEACPCDCGCAVPEDPDAGKGCPCACGCTICAAATPENAAAQPGLPPATESARVPASEVAAAPPQSPAPDTAPAPAQSIKESAVSETETPAVEAATPTPAPQAPAAAPMVALTQEQLAQLLAAARPQVAEAAPTVPQQPAAPVPVEHAAAIPAQPAPAAPPAPAQEAAQRTDLAETVANAVSAALAQAIPALRDSIVSQYGLPPRTGFRTTEADQNGAEMTAEQMWDNRADLLLGGLGKVG